MPTPPDGDQPPTRSTPAEWLGILRRRRWLVLAPLILVPLAALAASLAQPTEYEATAEVELTRPATTSRGTVLEVRDALSLVRFAQTQARVAKSEAVAARTLRALDGTDPRIGALVYGAEVTADPSSDVLDFRVQGEEPRLGVQVVNELAAQYIGYRRELAARELAGAGEEVARRLRALRAQGEEGSDLFRDLQRQERELRTREAGQTSDAVLVERAQSASEVDRPVTRNAALGLGLGLAIGLGLALLAEALDPRARRAREAADASGFPLLGRLPRPAGARDGRVFLATAAREADPYRLLRARLQLALGEGARHTVLVTSATDGEGKSTTALNLAAAAARAGTRVVLVELDLRRPTLAAALGLDDGPGVGAVLARETRLEQVVRPVALPAEGPASGSLELIAAGAPREDAGELLQSTVLPLLLDSARARGDLMVIDGPPLLTVGDALLLADRVDGVLLVARLGRVPRAALREAARVLGAASARPLGVVVTGVDPREVGVYD